MRLNYNFYQQDAITLAKNLLGKLLVRKIKGKEIICKIVETEAYMGLEDKASHAYQNKRTKRTKIMYKRGGYAYVYTIYGIYNCLNIIANKKDVPEAVFIRSVEPIKGIEIIKENRKIKSKKMEELTNGPSKLCQALNIDKKLNGYDLTKGKVLYIENNDWNFKIVSSKRINIDYAEEYKDKLWRFYIENNLFVSKKI